MLRKAGWLLIFLLFWGTGQALAGGIAIVVHEQAVVTGSVITLGDIADVSGSDSARVEALREISLGNAPAPGSDVVLTPELLGARLAASGADFSGVSWQTPQTVYVSAASQTISGQDVLNRALATVRGQLGAAKNSKTFDINPAEEVADTVVPAGAALLKANIPYGIRFNTPTTVNVAILIDGVPYTTISVRVNVKQFQNVVVAAAPIASRDALTTGSVRYERMDVGRLAAGYITDINKVVGLMARRSITDGMIITESMLDEPVVIKRGSMVNIVARIGGIEVTAVGQAMQDGRQGEVIRVQNMTSRKMIAARVINDSSVLAITYNGK
ncbi:flga cterm: flagella basal body p-ring formation protein flga [Lucifera butyrica]|uniref:Flga cterm: flagella basal body p-ring formation protein flga n=1 Tax=Lucifera butyrica TaxID=1351585 RepID=A0A498R880_9FIRM|nr:flagellar basal body P-ring formation chaperone FlgA [Lucifera butyrica]VBB08916.1 flga cterm: flagella basal body p-ring formation protein flga [Lucifera butyrica]